MVLVTNYAVPILKYAENYGDYICNPYRKESFFYRQIRKIFKKRNIKYIEKMLYNQALCGIEDCIVVLIQI